MRAFVLGFHLIQSLTGPPLHEPAPLMGRGLIGLDLNRRNPRQASDAQRRRRGDGEAAVARVVAPHGERRCGERVGTVAFAFDASAFERPRPGRLGDGTLEGLYSILLMILFPLQLASPLSIIEYLLQQIMYLCSA